MLHPRQTLRDKKKEATSTALAEAAYELALERGLDGFLVDDVAERAGVSRRTFANYFSCKEEAVATAAVTVSGGQEEYEELMASLPPDAVPLDILHRLLRMQLTAGFLQRLRRFVALSKRYPALEPYTLSVFRRVQLAAQEVLEQFVRGRYPAWYVQLLVGAVYGACVPILEGNLNVRMPGESENDSPGALPFDQFLETTFAYLRTGF
ncbi:TetR/AcrR family transcriptional regulator [Paenibacillus glufosinatiresistens]|uniref:TetR/AcrR family transcriptional regulator n=1 Tax=Paenibacillus glufosinatiresistens TaxID=3070657 RepID=UPI00286E4F6B|nr:TetR/AcrR family transcriptional regulator [Paenibacillus sp. YX.27]